MSLTHDISLIVEFAGAFRAKSHSGEMRWKGQGAFISPQAFLAAAAPLPQGAYRPAVEKYRKMIRDKKAMEMPRLFLTRNEASGGQPFRVQGHEGRHRATAAIEEGIKRIPVEVTTYGEPRYPSRSPALRKEISDPTRWKPQDMSAALNPVEFASALRKRVKVVVDAKNDAKMFLGGRQIGSIQRRSNVGGLGAPRSIAHSDINPAYRGMGLATKMYGEVARRSPGQALRSDNALLDSGVGVWNRVQRKGKWKVWENPKIDAGDEGILSRDGRSPVFIGKLPRASKLSATIAPIEFAQGKRFEKVVKNRETGRTRTVKYGQAGKAADGGDRIRPGTSKGDSYCARSAKIKGDWRSDPNSPNNLSRQKWKCRGSVSTK